ncbi:MAG: MBOAT family O-acyltransferase [Eubacterium sp.]|nr:MBOAT family O-acyltransferase [Eubacterium sp.]
MQFNSMIFLLLFLPIVVFGYYRAPSGIKNVILLAASLLFYSWGSPLYLLVLAFYVVFNYFAGLQIEQAALAESGEGEMPVKWKSGGILLSKLLTITTVAGNCAVLVLFLAFNPLYGGLASMFSSSATASAVLPLPLGIGFFTLSAISYAVDLYMGRIDAERSIFNFALYLSFFPKVIGGPLVRYGEFAPQLPIAKKTRRRQGRGQETILWSEGRRPSKKLIGSGLNLFLIGLFKKVLIADGLLQAFQPILTAPKRSILSAWLGILYFGFGIYFDLSGLSDMAIGLARMFGFEIARNFDRPYHVYTLREVWQKFDISVKSFFMDYVYLPLGGSIGSIKSQAINLCVSWVAAGLWHGIGINFAVWGLWNAGFILLERCVIRDRLDRLPGLVRRFLTLLVVFLGWIFLFSNGIGGALVYFGALIGAGGAGFADAIGGFSMGGNFLLLVLSLFLCTPYASRLYNGVMTRKNDARIVVSIILYVLLFIVCLSGIASGNSAASLARLF